MVFGFLRRRRNQPAKKPEKPVGNGVAGRNVTSLGAKPRKGPRSPKDRRAEMKQAEVRKAEAAEKKAAENKQVAAAEAVQRAEMLRQGATIPEFVEACRARSANPNQLFRQLYARLSRIRKLAELETDAEVGSGIAGTKFSEGQFWADIMLANNLEIGKRIKIPKKYLQYMRTKGKK